MKTEIKAKFVEALRSGNYSKGKKALRIGNCFCATGVLCDIFVKENNIEWKQYKGSIHPDFGLPVNIEFLEGPILDFSFPPDYIKKWASLTFQEELALVYANDTKDLSFEEIANQVEQWL